MINIEDLYKIKQKKESLRAETYNKILSKCHQKIVKFAEKEETSCFYLVPHFMMGAPLYDLKTCVLYLMFKLKKNGFKVNFANPNILYINWKKEPIKKEDDTQTVNMIQNQASNPVVNNDMVRRLNNLNRSGVMPDHMMVQRIPNNRKNLAQLNDNNQLNQPSFVNLNNNYNNNHHKMGSKPQSNTGHIKKVKNDDFDINNLIINNKVKKPQKKKEEDDISSFRSIDDYKPIDNFINNML